MPIYVNPNTRVSTSSVPIATTFNYNLDGTVQTVVKDNYIKSFTYNLNGTINTVFDGTYTKTFAYGGDGTLTGISIL